MIIPAYFTLKLAYSVPIPSMESFYSSHGHFGAFWGQSFFFSIFRKKMKNWNSGVLLRLNLAQEIFRAQNVARDTPRKFCKGGPHAFFQFFEIFELGRVFG